MSSTPDAPRRTAQDEVNGRLYRRAEIVRSYAKEDLNPPEAVTLIRYRDDIIGRRILDLGCGAGRLAVCLRQLTDRYVGLDSSPHMVSYCRRRYTGLQFHQGDMRELSLFADGSIDTVLAVFNLFDAVSHADRLRTLAEVRRVLTPGGLLVFSAHNRKYARAAARPRLSMSRNPVTQLRLVAEYGRSLFNYCRIRGYQREETDYALLNDSAHNHSVLHYYIDKTVQARQLAETGFRLLECLDQSGRTLGPGDDDSAYVSIHYLARAGS